MLKWMAGVAKRLDISSNGVRIAVLQYSSRTNVEWKLADGSDAATIQSKISAITYRGGGTRTGRAIDYAMANMWDGARSGVPRVMITVTDGRSYDSSTETPLLASNRAKAWRGTKGEKVTMYAIGVARAVLSQLNEISSDPDDKYVVFFYCCCLLLSSSTSRTTRLFLRSRLTLCAFLALFSLFTGTRRTSRTLTCSTQSPARWSRSFARAAAVSPVPPPQQLIPPRLGRTPCNTSPPTRTVSRQTPCIAQLSSMTRKVRHGSLLLVL